MRAYVCEDADDATCHAMPTTPQGGRTEAALCGVKPANGEHWTMVGHVGDIDCPACVEAITANGDR